MNIENMIYIYLFVCLSMIVFNVFTAIMFKRRDKRTVRVSESFKQRVERQLDRIRLGIPCDARHRRYLASKLKRSGNMIAFDRMLEAVYINDAEAVKRYLSELDSVFVALCAYWCGKDRIEAAFFPYVIKKYRIIAFKTYPTINEMLIGLLDEPSIYCRENAMQALYTTGDSECIMQALKMIDKSELFYHGKLISDGLLNFVGSARELTARMIEAFDDFSVDMQINFLNYMRFSNPDCREFAYSLLCDDKRDDEIHYSAIRYLGKYPYDKAYDKLYALADCSNDGRWEYSAIASSALASYPCERTKERLKSNLSSRHWHVRYNSAEGLERMGTTYSELADILEGEDRYASEILRYRLQRKKADGGESAV